ncbi:MAG: dTDP-4-dehydrorhamnose 3,5-epimerase family protein [Acidimicrobiaceae bacterium]|nr:dTDP-4-dehydrorhamnose 3,5-epimerase family protein [Acidimicrobiaceae bacterium]
MIFGLNLSEQTTGTDSRGVVREYFRRSSCQEDGLIVPEAGWAQINVTESNYGAIRGLHAEATDKLVGIISGEAYGVWIDGRPGSATFGNVVTAQLRPGLKVFVPSGVLNGFQSLADPSQYLYCFSAEWSRDMEGFSVNPLDEELGIRWPVSISHENRDQISEKDATSPTWESTRRILLNRSASS